MWYMFYTIYSCMLKVLWNGSRTARIHFWIPDVVFKAQTWLVNPTSSWKRDQAIFLHSCSRWLRGMVCDTRDRLITRWKVEMMAYDPTVVNIKRGCRHPEAGLVLTNFLHYDNMQCIVRLRNDFRFRSTFKLAVFFLIKWKHHFKFMY